MKTFNNLNERIQITNMMGWPIGYHSHFTNSDTTIDAYEQTNITFGELQAEVASDNLCFVGTDGHGAHCSFMIEDKDAREFLFGTQDEPVAITQERINGMMAAKTQKGFEDAVKDLIVRKAEAREILQRFADYDFNNQPEWRRKILYNHCWALVNGDSASAVKAPVYR